MPEVEHMQSGRFFLNGLRYILAIYFMDIWVIIYRDFNYFLKNLKLQQSYYYHYYYYYYYYA